MSEPRIAEVDPDSADAVWCLTQYYAELRDRFEEGFDPAMSVAADPGRFRRPHGAFLVAYIGDRPVGCGGVKLTSAEVGYIKRMWVDRSRRGRGLGRILLAALESTAGDLGCAIVQLETNQALTGAMRPSERQGIMRWIRSTTSTTRITGSKRSWS